MKFYHVSVDVFLFLFVFITLLGPCCITLRRYLQLSSIRKLVQKRKKTQ